MNMPGKKIDLGQFRFWPHGVLLLLLLAVVTLSVMAFVHPAASPQTQSQTPEMTESPTPIQLTETDAAVTTQTVEILPPPTADEIGSTDGIIFGSTILILILLIATLRETLQRKGK